MKKYFFATLTSLTSLLTFSYLAPAHADTGIFYPSGDGSTYRITTAGGLDSNWDINMAGNSAAWGTPAITYFTSSPGQNDKYGLVWDNTYGAYTIRPRVEPNGDACLTENPSGKIELRPCLGYDFNDNQHFWIQCSNSDNAEGKGKLSGCYISNALHSSQAIGTDWGHQNYPIGETNYSPSYGLWWNFIPDN
ncbi:hypothetical protein [Nostoc sp.]|uniref:hypothetical protein n=1 Tax=Nostoc sp. TaxID=1180 RepID=UPI002FF94D78